MTKSTDTIVMIAPTRFGFNEETCETNSFQNKINGLDSGQIADLARLEFDNFVRNLRLYDIKVLVYEDHPDSLSPDSIFPNNWFSTHNDGTMIIYPMAVQNRRNERRSDILDDLKDLNTYQNILHFESFEDDEPPSFLEGTGSLVFDHAKKTIYAAVSPRTDMKLAEIVAAELRHELVTFEALGAKGEAIYHTNVMLCIGEDFVIVGSNTIKESDKMRVLLYLKATGKTVIELTNDQVYNHFAGNMIQLRNVFNERILVMSDRAFKSLNEQQVKLLEKHNEHILHVPLHIIETIGGGSARCMIAEVFKCGNGKN